MKRAAALIKLGTQSNQRALMSVRHWPQPSNRYVARKNIQAASMNQSSQNLQIQKGPKVLAISRTVGSRSYEFSVGLECEALRRGLSSAAVQPVMKLYGDEMLLRSLIALLARPNHGRHIVLCPSRGRAHGKLINYKEFNVQQAYAQRSFFVFVVEPSEREAYQTAVAKHGGDALVLTLPEDGRRVGFARFCIGTLAHGCCCWLDGSFLHLKAPRYFTIDDNVTSVQIYEDDGFSKVASSRFSDAMNEMALLSDIEKFALVGVASAGKESSTFEPAKDNLCLVNSLNLYKFLYVNTAQTNGIVWQPWLRFAEDIVFFQTIASTGAKLLKLRYIHINSAHLKQGGCDVERSFAAAPRLTEDIPYVQGLLRRDEAQFLKQAECWLEQWNGCRSTEQPVRNCQQTVYCTCLACVRSGRRPPSRVRCVGLLSRVLVMDMWQAQGAVCYRC